MQPFIYDLLCPAAKDTTISHAAAAPSKTMRSAQAELQNAIGVRATASEIAAPKPGSRGQSKKNDFEALFKGILKEHRRRKN